MAMYVIKNNEVRMALAQDKIPDFGKKKTEAKSWIIMA